MQNNQIELITRNTPLSQLTDKVRRWTILDTMLKRIQEKTKEMRVEKQELTETICQIMTENNLHRKKIAIRMYEKNDYTPLSYGYLEECLGEIIEDKNQVEYVLQYLKDHRETKTSFDLRRTYKSSEDSKMR
jgi:hypothetical protein